MHNRLRLLRLMTALMYFGPLLAGLMGQGWAMVAVFLAIFLLWSVILRPHLWPASLRDLGQVQAAVPLASLVATQLLLVIVLFAVGRGIGGVLAVKPLLPDYLPAALSFLSVPVSRMIWNPRVAAENAGFNPVTQDIGAQSPEGLEMAEEMLAQVLALPETVTETELQSHLTAIAAHIDPVMIRRVLGDVVAQGKATRAGVKALIVHATDASVSFLLSGSGYPAQGFRAAGRDARLLTLFARRCALALDDEPEIAADCPTVGDLRLMAQQVGDADAAAGLNRLAGRLDQGAPREQAS